MNSGTVSILIPTYKRPNKLKRAITSVLSQTYADLKVIVCDNASGDETSEIAALFMQQDSRVRYYQQSENIGMNANFNFAVSKVETPFFALLADDDYYLPNFLMDAMHGFEKYPAAMFSVLEVPVINERDENNVLRRILDKWPKEGIYYPAEAIHLATGGAQPNLTACVFREALKPELYFDDEVGHISDVPILITLIAKYTFCLSKTIGLYFVRHPDAIGNTPSWHLSWYLWFRLERVIKKNTTLTPESMTSIQRLLRKRIDKLSFFWLLQCIKVNDMETFDKIYSSLVNRPFSIYQIGGRITHAVMKFKWTGNCFRYVLDAAYNLLRRYKDMILD